MALHSPCMRRSRTPRGPGPPFTARAGDSNGDIEYENPDMLNASNRMSTSSIGAKGDCVHLQSFPAGPLLPQTLQPGTLELHCRLEERRNNNNTNHYNLNFNLFTSDSVQPRGQHRLFNQKRTPTGALSRRCPAHSPTARTRP